MILKAQYLNLKTILITYVRLVPVETLQNHNFQSKRLSKHISKVKLAKVKFFQVLKKSRTQRRFN